MCKKAPGPFLKKAEHIVLDSQEEKWYFKTSVFVVALLCVGPLALPLLWLNPRFSLKTKVIITAGVAVLSYYLAIVTVNSLKSIAGYYRMLQ